MMWPLLALVLRDVGAVVRGGAQQRVVAQAAVARRVVVICYEHQVTAQARSEEVYKVMGCIRAQNVALLECSGGKHALLIVYAQAEKRASQCLVFAKEPMASAVISALSRPLSFIASGK